MGWARFDDGYSDNPKVLELSALAELLDVRAIIFCARTETDGLVTPKALRQFSKKIRRPEDKVAELVMAGRWTVNPDGGWVVHDFLKYNPSKAEREALREDNRSRQKKWRSKVTNALVTYGTGNKEQIDSCTVCAGSGFVVDAHGVVVMPPVKCDHPDELEQARRSKETG